MGFGISHQKAGLNWPGRYKAWSRERAVVDAWRAWVQRKRGQGSGYRVQGIGNGNGEHAKWRRITGITGAVEGVLTAKERRRGLKRLVAWIEENYEPQRRGDAENGKGLGLRVDGLGSGDEATELSLTARWRVEVEAWVRPGSDRRSVESLCVELQISRARLTMLTKEYCGLTVQELVDGFKVRKLKSALVARLREAAQGLWGLPGTLAAWKYDGYRVSGFGEMTRARRPRDSRRDAGGTNLKRSRYFRMRPEDYAGEERWAERARRIGELVDALRRNFDLEDWAARVGFASGARLKRACLNVLGRSLRAIERALAEETVRYYICAEDKVLRQVACGDDNNPRVIRARWIYGKSEDPPKEPFLDEWSKAEELARDWLDRMRGAFGCT